MQGRPRNRATMRQATLNAQSQPFGHTTANLASGGVCCTARLLRPDRVVKTAHRPRLRLVPLRRLAHQEVLPVASCLAAHIPKPWHH